MSDSKKLTNSELRDMTREFFNRSTSSVEDQHNDVSETLLNEAVPIGMDVNLGDNLRMLSTVIDNLTEMALGYDTDEELKGELLMQVELLQDVYSSMYNTTVGYRK